MKEQIQKRNREIERERKRERRATTTVGLASQGERRQCFVEMRGRKQQPNYRVDGPLLLHSTGCTAAAAAPERRSAIGPNPGSTLSQALIHQA